MSLILYIFIFFLGAILASFFDVLAQRTANKKTISGRSFCPQCKKIISWIDLVPIFSWIFLRGKCRFCGQKISKRHIWGEIILGVVFVLVAYNFDLIGFLVVGDFSASLIWQVLFGWFLSCFLFAIFLIDLNYFIIPDRFLWFLFGGVFLNWIFLLVLNLLDWAFIMNRVLAGVCFFLLFFFIFLISKGRWLGFGDVKYFLVAGILLGFEGFFVMIFIASLVGALVGILQIVFGGKNLKSKLPFGVFLAPATLIAYFFSENFLEILFKHLYI